MRSEVAGYIRNLGLMRAGDRVAVAVSGGADSVALLRVLLELRAELGMVLAVAHFNHGLRGKESEADQAFVADLARHHGLQFFAGGSDVRGHASTSRLSVEAAGRELRYAWFVQLAEEERFDSVATAHTLDDQAETVLLKLLRGAGTRGLAGIYPSVRKDKNSRSGVRSLDRQGPSREAAAGVEPGARAPEPRRLCADWGPGVPGELVGQSEPRSGDNVCIVRPLLCITRDEVEAYLSSLGQEWREDESNFDHRYARNRVRHELLPLLEREYNPNIRQVLSDAAEVTRAEEEYWHKLVELELESCQLVEPRDPKTEIPSEAKAPSGLGGLDGTAEAVPFQTKASERRLNLANFRTLPLALQRRLLRRFAESQNLTLDFEHVEKLLRCAIGELARTEMPEGWLVSRRGDRLELCAPAAEQTPGSYEYTLAIPGEVGIAELGLTLRAIIVRQEFALDSGEPDSFLSADLLGPELTVRNWRHGDRFWPVHRGSGEKLKRLFAEKRIREAERRTWPVALVGDDIVWVRGFPVARAYSWNGKGDAVRFEAIG